MAANDILQGWNAIAEFLSCDVRTAKRWETERGLPVRRTWRTPGEGRANVHAVIAELEAWTATAKSSGEAAAGVGGDEPEDVRAAEGSNVPAIGFWSRPWVVAGTVGAVCLLGATLALLGRGRTKAKTESERAASEPRHSVVAASSGGASVQELYLHGSYLFEQRTPETLAQAKSDFEQAIATDPRYAPAYAGLAKTYDLLREYATMPAEQAYPLAKAAALRAIALDPNLADAHAALGYEEFFWEWNGAEAEREFPAGDRAGCELGDCASLVWLDADASGAIWGGDS